MSNKFYLNDDDKNNIKIIKYIQELSSGLEKRSDAQSQRVSALITEVEEMFKQHGIPIPERSQERLVQEVSIEPQTYEEILVEAEEVLGGKDVELTFDDILSQDEIKKAYDRVDEIREQFSKATGIFNKRDLSFLAIATALQTIKWIFTPEIGHGFDPDTRLDHNDPSIKAEQNKKLKEFRDKHYKKGWQQEYEKNVWPPKKKKKHRKTWIEILFTKAPYDKIKGSAALGIGLGPDHRLKTLGHDPILGWIFGTANFMTDTATLIDLRSYRIENAMWKNELVTLPTLFNETLDLTMYDWHCLAAALVAQGAHLASDKYTKMGLPIPLLSMINEVFASKLYNEHYDYLCAAKDLKVIGRSAAFSMLINMIISFAHGMFYDPKVDGPNRDLYEVRTRKILLISNLIASSSNIIYSALTNNPHRLDIGGILVTLGRLFLDAKFIIGIKGEFIQNHLNNDLQQALDEIDRLYGNV